MDEELLKLVRCPDDLSPLAFAEPALIAQLNSAIEAGWLVDRAGRNVTTRLDGGLVREAGDLLYPIVDQIPVLIRDESIPLSQLNPSSRQPS